MKKEMIMRMLMTGSLVLLTALSALSWIKTIDEDLTWIYYNGDAVYGDKFYCEALYEMAFVDSVKIDSQTYNCFRVTKAVLKPKGNYADREPVFLGMSKDYYLFREEKGKIWIRDRYEKGDFLMYDYSTKRNDPFPGNLGGKHLCWLPDTTLTSEDIPRKVYTCAMSPVEEGERPDPSQMIVEDLRCIEGIGTTRGFLAYVASALKTTAYPEPISDVYPGEDSCCLVGVRNKAGEYIYGSRHPMEDLFAGVPGVEADDDTSPRYFNLQGLPVESPKPGDLLIKVSGNKSEKIVRE